MDFMKKVVVLMIMAAIQFPCYAAEEDKELSLIAAEQENSEEELDEINPALTESISTEPTQETDKEIKERKKKLRQTRKEKEKANEQKLKDSAKQKDKPRRDERITIEPSTPKPTPQPINEPSTPKPTPQPINEPSTPKSTPQPINEPSTPKPTPQPINEPSTPKSTPQPINEPSTPKPTPQPINEPSTPKPTPQPINEPSTPKPTLQPINEPSTPKSTPQPINEPSTPNPITEIPTPQITPQIVETVALPNQKLVYANFIEVARAVKFIPLYMSRKSGYEITALYAGQGIAEVRYGRRWEPTVSLKIRTHKRAEGEALQDISGVTGVKWRVDTSTGTTIYIAKISETQQVAAWAVGHYTFSAQAENLSYAGFHSLVADELVELSTHYYLDL